MNIKIFTTTREIRKWLEIKNNQFLDKFYTIGEFLEKIIVVEKKVFIDNYLRKKYLFEAIKNIEIEKLGISRDFLNFFYDSDFIFSFFNELFLEEVEIDKIILNDIYLDYEEHLVILKEIKNSYENLLKKDRYIDKFLIKEFKINEGLLKNVEKIEIFLDGYLSKFDLKVLSQINIAIEIYFSVDKFNKSLVKKMFNIEVEEDFRYKFNFKNKKLQKLKQIKKNPNINVTYFSDRINQIDFVFANIARMVEAGIEPSKIAVILPDESFSEFLELFDEYKNLNFAMGKSFTKSNLFIKLNSIYEYLINQDEISFAKCSDFYEDFLRLDLVEFVLNLADAKEKSLIAEELFKLDRFRDKFSDKKEFLFFILERFKKIRIDDVYSGKITCMGVLESRGVEFDGVILIDFNEEFVPKVSENDLFLNTFIRKLASLPTKIDKENLQKHYFYQLINNAKEVAISFVKNEESQASRFLYELGLDSGVSGDNIYNNIAINFSKEKKIFKYDEKFKIIYPLYPTKLKTLLECPKKYYFSEILKIKDETEDEKNFGNIFHNAIAKVVKNKSNLKNELDYFKRLLEEITAQISDKKLLFEILVKYEESLKKFCKIDFIDMMSSTNLVEFKVEPFIFEDKGLCFRADRIDIKNDEIVLIDYKTSKKAELNEKYIYEFQTTFYYLWAKQNYPDKKIKTIIFDIIEAKKIEGILKVELLSKILKNLPTNTYEAKDIEFGEKIIKKASEICKWCEYNVACGRD